MPQTSKKMMAVASSAALLVALAGCESNGSTRFSGVGAAGPRGPQGIQGPAGPEGPAGPAGPAGADGAGGANGSNGSNGLPGLGGLGALAVGGLVGPDGVAGTGLLANTGDPDSRLPVVSGVLVAGGNAVQSVAQPGTILADRVDAALPGGIPIAGRVVEVVENTGQALVRAGNGQDYLVDGLTAAPGALVNLTVGNARVLGAEGQSPLIGASLLSPSQNQGEALTVGAGSAGEVLTLASPATGGGLGGNVVGSVIETVTGAVPGAGGNGSAPTNVVTGVVDTVTGVLQPGAGDQDGEAGNPVQGVVDGVVGGVLGGGGGGSNQSGGLLGGVLGGGLLGGGQSGGDR